MFNPAYPLDAITPADYNPRSIDVDARKELLDSLDTLGCLKPLIVTDAGRLIAGHQRTAAMQSLGWKSAPAYVLHDVNAGDEIRFNQLHNGADLDLAVQGLSIAPNPAVGASLPRGWCNVGPLAISGDLGAQSHASERHEILRLLAKHGSWGNCIATDAGEILTGGLYAQACRILHRPLLVRVVPASWAPAILQRFGREYGRFSYSHLPAQTWAQSLAQLPRIPRTGGRILRSRTYENLVIPRLRAGDRVLDFGAGRMDYVRKLRADGVDIIGIEFYSRRHGSQEIDSDAAHAQVDELCDALRTAGRFDVVVADSVLNSVDSLEAEAAVMGTLHALCRPYGRIVASGRTMPRKYGRVVERDTSMSRRYVDFLDDDGFTAMYRDGVWMFQKHHTAERVLELGRRYIGADVGTYDREGLQLKRRPSSNTWALAGTKSAHLPDSELEAAIRFEFDLPLPDGTRYGRAGDVLSALEDGSGSCLHASAA